MGCNQSSPQPEGARVSSNEAMVSSSSSAQMGEHVYGYADILKNIQEGNASEIRRILLINHRALDGVDDNGNTLLHHACYKDDLEQAKCLETLLERPGIKMDSVNNSGLTPMHCAAINSHYRAMRVLARSGARYDIFDANGQTALHLACLGGCNKGLEGVIGCGINVFPVENAEGQRLLHTVAGSGQTECLQTLLKARPRPEELNATDTEGNTPLHEAALYGQAQTAELLLKAGCTKKAQNNSGMTPLQVAVAQDFSRVAMVLGGAPAESNALGQNGSGLVITDADDDETKGLTPADSTVFELVQGLMDVTWKSVTTRDRHFKPVQHFQVVQVLANDNPELQARFQVKAEELLLHYAKTVDGVKTVVSSWEDHVKEPRRREINEYYLFHGTKPTAALEICRNGFRAELAGSGKGTLYGPGIYFAESSTKADEYAGDDDTGLYKGLYAMLLCRVALGNPVVTAELSPNVERLHTELSLDVNHSILGDREAAKGTFREFVVPHADQALPTYVIIYRRTETVG